MRWIEWDGEKLGKLRTARWLLSQGKEILKMSVENKVVIGPEAYLYSGNPERFDRIISMNAWLEFPNQPVAGMKWISSKAANVKNGLPRGGAVTILNDAVTGYPVIAYNSTPVSAARTVMVNCLALERLFAEYGPRSMTLIGTGQIHAWQATFVRQLWPGCQFYVYDLDSQRQKEFAKVHDCRILTGWREGLGSDVFSMATAGTTSVGWMSWRTDLKGSSPVWLHTSLRDMQPRLEEQFGLVVVDDHVLATSEGTTHSFAWRENWVKKEISLADLVIGGYEPEVADYPVLVTPMGLAMWDIGIGYRLFEKEFGNALD